MFKNSKKLISLILSLILVLSFGAFSSYAEETETETAPTVISGISVSSGTLSPAFNKDIHQYIVKVDSLSSCPTVTATVEDGGDSSKVKIAQAQNTSGYVAVVTVMNDAADKTTWDSYIITFVTDSDVEILDVESEEYIAYIGSGLTDETASYDKKVWTRTKTHPGYIQSWDLGEVKEISEIRFLIAFSNSQKDVYNKGWEISIDGSSWTPLPAFSAATSYSANLFNIFGGDAYVMYHGLEMEESTYARYIKRTTPSTEYNFTVQELFVMGGDPTPDTEIEVSEGLMYPAFSEDVTDYKVSVNSLSSLPTISATCSSLYEVTVTQASADNNYKATVTVSLGGNALKTYTFTITDEAMILPIVGYVNSGNCYSITTGGGRYAEYAYDGNYDNTWTPNVACDNTYDLGQVYELSSIFMKCGNGATASSSSYVAPGYLGAYATLELSVDGINWYKASGWQGKAKMSNKTETVLCPDGVERTISRYINFTFDDETVARYFRFTGFKAWEFAVNEIVPVGKPAATSLTNPAADGTGVQVYTTSAVSGTAFCAYYDAEGTILDIVSTPFAASGKGAHAIAFAAAPTGTASSRIYLWNGTTLVPLTINKATAPAVPNVVPAQ